MFGFYIQFHGEIAPGGGFQSGIIFSIPFILYTILYGDNTKPGIVLTNTTFYRTIASIGIIIYILAGVLCTIPGGKYLQYSVLIPSNPVLANQIGIFIVEFGICLGVFGSMCTIFTEMYLYITKNIER